MSFLFTPPPIAGDASVDPSFSEFVLRRVGEIESLPLDELEQGLQRHDFKCRDLGSLQGLQILACDEIGPPVLTEVERIRSSGGGPILVVSARCPNSPSAPWDLLCSGADDFLLWNDTEETVAAVAARLQRWKEMETAISVLQQMGIVVGVSPIWRRTLGSVVEAARFGDAPVLIAGETGTGKELLARSVHLLDPRPDKGELVLLDGATLNPELSGSELFGHEKGAFTGAIDRREGALARAHRGTLFLDEVGEVAPVLQGELLRAVQDGAYKPVGGNCWKESRFRLVCATNRDLRKAVDKGTFRGDLYFRLAGSVCHIPPLRERREDIPFLVDHFLKTSRPDHPPTLDPMVAEFLMRRDYPGNVRELRQVVTRLLSRHPGRGPLTIATIPESERPQARRMMMEDQESVFEAAVRSALACGKGLEEIRKTATKTAYALVLAQEQGDTGKAALRLQVSPRAVQMFVKTDRESNYGCLTRNETA